MDKRTILAVFLSIAIYYGWLIVRGPPPGEPTDTDGIAAVDGPEQAGPDQAVPPVPPPPSPTPEPAPDLPLRTVPFDMCGAQGEFTSNHGGALQGSSLRDWRAPYDVQPLYSWAWARISGATDEPWKPYGDPPGPEQILSVDSRALSVGSGPQGAIPPRMKIVEEGRDRVTVEGRTADGLTVRRTVSTLFGEPCLLDVQVSWTNVASTPFNGDVWLGIHDVVPPSPTGMLARYKSVRQPRAYVDGDLEYGVAADIVEEGSIPIEGPVSWFGVADRYFGFLALPETDEGRFAFDSAAGDEPLPGGSWRLEASLAPGAEYTQSFRIYIGPLDLDILREVDDDLPGVVDLGWFAFFAKPLQWLLELFYAGVHNWGLAIVMLTLLVKLIFFPLTQTAFKSSQAMAALQPEMQKLREEYKDNPEEQQRKTMELFKEHGVNPLGGCLPMFLQLPVWIALYNVLLSSVELYHTPFLYLRDLSVVDPYCVGPLVVVVLMVVQQQFTPTGNMDPTQARMMKLMPLFFGLFFFTFPGGLVVYIFVNMVLSILQQWLIRRTFKGTAPATAT